MEEKKEVVTLIVTIDEELLRRMDTAVQPTLAAEGITRVELGEEGLHFITTAETGSTHTSLLEQLAIKQQQQI